MRFLGPGRPTLLKLHGMKAGVGPLNDSIWARRRRDFLCSATQLFGKETGAVSGVKCRHFAVFCKLDQGNGILPDNLAIVLRAYDIFQIVIRLGRRQTPSGPNRKIPQKKKTTMKISRILAVVVVASLFSAAVSAQTITTEFNTSDGFVTGPINGGEPADGAFDDVTLTEGAFSVVFSGGQQQQGFDGGSYNNGPAGFLFVNTGGGDAVFTGGSGNTITGGANNGDNNGLISFGGFGASAVSFFAADRANGAATTIDILGTDLSLIHI